MTIPTAIERRIVTEIEEVPDENDPDVICYWRTLGDGYHLYLEGWCDECLAGTGFPSMVEGGWEDKMDYIRDMQPKALAGSDAQYAGKLVRVSSGLRELEPGVDADNLYAVTWALYQEKSHTRRNH